MGVVLASRTVGSYLRFEMALIDDGFNYDRSGEVGLPGERGMFRRGPAEQARRLPVTAHADAPLAVAQLAAEVAENRWPQISS